MGTPSVLPLISLPVAFNCLRYNDKWDRRTIRQYQDFQKNTFISPYYQNQKVKQYSPRDRAHEHGSPSVKLLPISRLPNILDVRTIPSHKPFS